MKRNTAKIVVDNSFKIEKILVQLSQIISLVHWLAVSYICLNYMLTGIEVLQTAAVIYSEISPRLSHWNFGTNYPLKDAIFKFTWFNETIYWTFPFPERMDVAKKRGEGGCSLELFWIHNEHPSRRRHPLGNISPLAVGRFLYSFFEIELRCKVVKSAAGWMR